MNTDQRALKLHQIYQGKIEIKSKVPLKTQEDLSLAYTPGVAAPCLEIANQKEKVYNYTWKGNSVAIVTDGTAVLGLGNIGPEAALPVMEGKAILFKEFAGIDAVPICLNTTDPKEIIETVERMAPSFGGVNLEDIAAPHCFFVEEELQKKLSIPVFHDDQHGTAIVVLAALINSLQLLHKSLDSVRIVVNGAGAAGTAIVKLLQKAGAQDIIVCDRDGILNFDDQNLLAHHKLLAKTTNPFGVKGVLSDALNGADVFIGVSKGNLLEASMISHMNQPIIFALANPIPEIMPDKARQHGAVIVGTGRSDFPNQINNLLAFPGVFKGALQARAPKITDRMKLAAAQAISEIVQKDGLTEENILPNPLDERVALKVCENVKKAYQMN